MDKHDATGAGVAPTRSPPVTLPGNDSGFATSGLFAGLLPSSCSPTVANTAVALADWALVYDLVQDLVCCRSALRCEVYDTKGHLHSDERTLSPYRDVKGRYAPRGTYCLR
ncbi:MAG: hypothetical protein ACYCST_04370 [Acidimicrobiales bacterium]